jgi:hypothetical protein
MKRRKLHSKLLGIISCLGIALCPAITSAQLSSNYNFVQGAGTYTPISGTLVAAATSADPGATPESAPMDDFTFTSIALPFSFSFNGSSYTEFNANTNGWISFGSVSTSSTSSPISSANAYGGVIAPFATDLQGVTVTTGDVTIGSDIITNIPDVSAAKIGAPFRAGTTFPAGTVITAVGTNDITVSNVATGTTAAGTTIGWASAEIRTEETGTAPFRTFTIQFSDFAEYATTGTSATAKTNINFQIILSEGGGVPSAQTIEIQYGNVSRADGSETVQVGLRGSTNTDFSNRTTTTDWATTTTGASNSATATWNTTVFPSSGLSFAWVPASCLTPSGLSVSGVTATSATLNFGSTGAADYSVEYGPQGFTPGTGTFIATGGANSATISGLTANGAYSFYVRSVCSATDSSNAAGPFDFNAGQVPVTVFPWVEDWETGGTDWTFRNGTEVNKWTAGTATDNGGAMSLYVSNDAGVSNVYSTGTTAAVQTYRDISFPAGSPAISLSFDWKSDGENGYDYLRVWLVPTSYTPTPGTQISAANSGGLQLGGNLQDQLSYTTANFTIPASYAGTDARLVFEWRNDGGGGTQPPASVDNVTITVGSCPAPTSLSATNLTTTSADLIWNENGSATQWTVEYGPAGFTQGTGTFVTVNGTPGTTINGLSVSTAYSFYVRSICSATDSSSLAGPANFSTTALGDECASAIPVPVTSGYCSTVVNRTVAGATTNSANGAFSCQSNTGGDIWFSFTAPASGNVGVIFQAGTVTDLVAAIYEGSCGALTQFTGACSDDNGPSTLPELHTTGLVGGNTYYVRVAGYNTNSGTFGMCVYEETGVSDPADGACNSVISLPVSGNEWVPFFDGNGKIVAAINPNGVNLGAVTVQYKDEAAGVVPQDTKGMYYIPRYFNIESLNFPLGNFPNPVTIRLFALDQELADYNTANGSSYAITDLKVSYYDGLLENCEQLDNDHVSTLITPAERIDNGNAFYVQFNSNHFTEFGLHGGTVPLPLDIVSLTATNAGARNRIDWSTATEQKGDEYLVERSADGQNFREIGSVNAKGEASSYSFWDEQPVAGINYYRLKLVEVSGESSYSNIVTATVKGSGSLNVDAYPNPASSDMTVKVSGPAAGNAILTITDLSGKVISSRSMSGSETRLDLRGMAPGLYLLKYSDDHNTQTIRITKQ